MEGKNRKHFETDDRPWGRWIKFTDNERCTVKILALKPGEALSFQSHKLRDETWFLISGKVRVHTGPVKASWEDIEPGLSRVDLSPGENITIGRHTVHSAENTGNDHCLILEISRGKFSEDDETRWKDRYGRA